jgi:hypothetical protein
MSSSSLLRKLHIAQLLDITISDKRSTAQYTVKMAAWAPLPLESPA